MRHARRDGQILLGRASLRPPEFSPQEPSVQTKPFLYLSLLAAGAAHSETLTGRLLSPDGAAPHRLRVNLLTASEKQQIEQTKPSRSGDFAISCPPGSYVLEVLNPKGRLMRRLPVRVPAPSPVEIDLRPRFEPATGANLVSLKRLRHQVPAQAEERFAAAHDAALAGNTEAAIAHLEAAIALDPDYRWAVVGHPGRDYLWILSRTPTMDEATYRGIVAALPDQGYDPTRLQRTLQPVSLESSPP